MNLMAQVAQMEQLNALQQEMNEMSDMISKVIDRELGKFRDGTMTELHIRRVYGKIEELREKFANVLEID